MWVLILSQTIRGCSCGKKILIIYLVYDKGISITRFLF
nr:MAG TPA: hypothetical protein [Caudoviricetes sp.]